MSSDNNFQSYKTENSRHDFVQLTEFKYEHKMLNRNLDLVF